MGEQKNLFLAIGLSVAIIVIFQFLFPQQAPITQSINEVGEKIQPTTPIDDNDLVTSKIIKSKDEIINLSDRIEINTPSVFGSINLKGAIIDDLILIKYNERLNDNSKKITHNKLSYNSLDQGDFLNAKDLTKIIKLNIDDFEK